MLDPTNEPEPAAQMSMAGDLAPQKLRSFVERIERLEEEKASLCADIRELYSEAKGHGFDTKIMRAVIKLRKLDPAARNELDELLDLYRRNLGV